MLEAAVMQVDEYCKRKDLVIAGSYYASPIFTDKQLSTLACKIGNKIQENYPNSCILLIDNSKLSKNPEELAVHIFTGEGKLWKSPSESIQLKDSSTLEALSNLLADDNAIWKLSDFDSHLDDLSKDWLSNQI